MQGKLKGFEPITDRFRYRSTAAGKTNGNTIWTIDVLQKGSRNVTYSINGAVGAGYDLHRFDGARDGKIRHYENLSNAIKAVVRFANNRF